MNIVILGPQGSGKGTQAVRIAERYKLKHISTGDIFRENVKNGTELGKKVQKIMNDGAFVPDEITNAIVKDTLQRVKKNFILDGYPRTLKQAEYLAKVIDVDMAINLDITDDNAVKRIASRRVCPNCGEGYNVITLKPEKTGICDKCGGKLVQREDDKPEAVKKRLEEYHKNTEPILGFYDEQGTLLTFDGSGEVNNVFERIYSEIDGKM